jgi:hypothetical protein
VSGYRSYPRTAIDHGADGDAAGRVLAMRPDCHRHQRGLGAPMAIEFGIVDGHIERSDIDTSRRTDYAQGCSSWCARIVGSQHLTHPLLLSAALSTRYSRTTMQSDIPTSDNVPIHVMFLSLIADS